MGPQSSNAFSPGINMGSLSFLAFSHCLLQSLQCMESSALGVWFFRVALRGTSDNSRAYKKPWTSSYTELSLLHAEQYPFF